MSERMESLDKKGELLAELEQFKVLLETEGFEAKFWWDGQFPLDERASLLLSTGRPVVSVSKKSICDIMI